MDPDRYLELAPDYALGLLEGDDLEQFERHLAEGCEACEVELARMDAVGDALAYAVPLVRAPEPLRDRVLAAIDVDLAGGAVRPAAAHPGVSALPARPGVPAAAPRWGAPTTPRGRPGGATSSPETVGFWSRVAPTLAVMGILAAGLIGAYTFKLRQQVNLMRFDLERVQAENQELTRVIDVVGSPRLEVIALAGQPPAPASEGRLFWSPEPRKAVFYGFGLPRPPAGKDYQLWVIEDSTPRSEGVFAVDEQGHASHVLPDLPDPARVGAFAVTLEPAGGLPQPSGPMYLLGAVTEKLK